MKITIQLQMLNWRINKLLLPHLYSGAKHIPLFSQRPLHLVVLIGALFVVTRQTQYVFLGEGLTKNICTEPELKVSPLNFNILGTDFMWLPWRSFCQFKVNIRLTLGRLNWSSKILLQRNGMAVIPKIINLFVGHPAWVN